MSPWVLFSATRLMDSMGPDWLPSSCAPNQVKHHQDMCPIKGKERRHVVDATLQSTQHEEMMAEL